MEKLKIKYFADEELVKPTFNKKGDWIDLRAAQQMAFTMGDVYTLIPLGIAVQLPPGYEALIVPRSSLFRNYGILQANSVGIIDESYCGDNDQWLFPAYVTHPTIVDAGDRICQFRIFKHQPEIEFETVESLGNPDRGGFGSTGKR